MGPWNRSETSIETVAIAPSLEQSSEQHKRGKKLTEATTEALVYAKATAAAAS